jgi:hypothetical protein
MERSDDGKYQQPIHGPSTSKAYGCVVAFITTGKLT